MKRIKFTELGFKKNLNTLIPVFGLVLFILGIIAFLGYIDEKYSALAYLSILFTSFPQMRTNFYKNYFIWNKSDAQIKVNSKAKQILFKEISSVQFENNNLILLKKDNTQLDFPLKNINLEDIKKLEEILKALIKN
ncbi:hypothetical protein ACFSX9_05440 [Flavobacterium ardleyense]|uniref:YcxB-like protein domain-containing protein n=1 Tax=Flavobacterium ardleyense TaxID=2038737 RepID=A0ABW5Z642_9FLAO